MLETINLIKCRAADIDRRVKWHSNHAARTPRVPHETQSQSKSRCVCSARARARMPKCSSAKDQIAVKKYIDRVIIEDHTARS